MDRAQPADRSTPTVPVAGAPPSVLEVEQAATPRESATRVQMPKELLVHIANSLLTHVTLVERVNAGEVVRFGSRR